MHKTSEAPGSFANALHGIFLSFPVALFSVGLAADIAYLNTAEIQWTNFAAWAIAGALVFGGVALAWALVEWLVKLRRPGRGRRFVYFAVLALMWAAGIVNAFHHAADGWSSVGTTGLALSVASAALALLAGGLFFSRIARWEMIR